MHEGQKGRGTKVTFCAPQAGPTLWEVADDNIWDYAEDLRRYATYLCHDVHDGEDVAQSALLKAAQSKDGAFRAEASVRTWLHTIVSNECRMLHRHQIPDSLDDLLDGGRTPPEVGVRRSSNPEAAALIAETGRMVLSSLRKLPVPYQQVLVLKDGCGMRTAEVAEILDTSVGATKSRLYRARKTMRDEVAQEPS